MALLNGLGFSKFINGKSNALAGIYARAYNQLVRDMQDGAATMWQRDRATAMLARVDAVVKSLDAETQRFIQKEVPATYFATGQAAKEQARKLGLTIPSAFGQIHTQAIAAAADDAMLKFGHTMVGIKRSAEEYVKLAQQRAIREQIAAGQIRGAAAEELAKEVKGMIEDQGITALIDRGGKRWQLDTYAEMLTRQVLANSGRDGVFNTAQEYGLDLAEITTHNTDHEECARWEGKVVSLSGKTPGYPSLDTAISEGLFHIGCKHGYAIVTDYTRPKPYDPSKDDVGYETVRIGDQDLDVKGGNFHRIVDGREYGLMLQTGELAPTPKGLFGNGEDDNKKFFGIDANVGKLVTQAEKPVGGRFEIVVNVKDMPDMRNDPKMKGASIYVTESIPLSKIKARKID